MCELVARHADGYTIFWQRTTEAIKEQYARVDAACRIIGRDPSNLLHSAFAPGSTVVPVDGSAPTTSAEKSAARLRTLCETVGAQYLVVTVAGPAHLERLIPVIEELRRIPTSYPIVQ